MFFVPLGVRYYLLTEKLSFNVDAIISYLTKSILH